MSYPEGERVCVSDVLFFFFFGNVCEFARAHTKYMCVCVRKCVCLGILVSVSLCVRILEIERAEPPVVTFYEKKKKTKIQRKTHTPQHVPGATT